MTYEIIHATKITRRYCKFENTESSIMVTDVGVSFHDFTVTIYSTTIIFKTHGDAITTINGENWQ